MSGKRTSTSTSSKPKRKSISLEQKLEIINKYEAGATKAKIGHDFSMNEGTIWSILARSKVYKNQGQSASSSSGLQTTRIRSSTMVEMEHLLSIWIEDCNQKRRQKLINLCQNSIKAKALSLFEMVEIRWIEIGNEKDS